MAELGSAPEKGRVGGNPGLRKHYPEPIAEVLHAGNRGYCEEFNKDGLHLLSTVRQFQLRRPWENIVRIINSRRLGAKTWTVERLRRATARFVKDWLPDRSGLDCASPAQKDNRLPAIIASAERSAPGMTLKQIAAQLEVM